MRHTDRMRDMKDTQRPEATFADLDNVPDTMVGQLIDGEKFFTMAPDWVLEVLSPSTASIDRIKKSRIYSREGVRWLWLADPIEKTMECLRHEPAGWLRVAEFEAGEAICAEPFAAEATDWWL
jgi:Uma2 family endonuclease